MGSIIALYFDGATCTFHELPKPEDMKEIYASIKAKPVLLIRKVTKKWIKKQLKYEPNNRRF